MSGCIVLHKYRVFLEYNTILFHPWHQILLKELGISCRVNFDTIFDFKRSHQFVVYDASPEHHDTPFPPYCRLNRVGAARPCATHPHDHPSRPSSVASISSVKRTRLKSCFRYWTDHARCFSLWILVSGGLLGDFFVELQVDRIWHCVVLFTPEIPHASKTCLLVWRGFCFTSLERCE